MIAHYRMGGKVNSESERVVKQMHSGLEDSWTECVLFVRMSGDGKRIVEVREIVDSARAEELKRRLTEVFE